MNSKKSNKNISSLVITANLISIIFITAHLVNKEYEWFPTWLFCIRSIRIIFVFNIILLIGWIFFLLNKEKE